MIQNKELYENLGFRENPFQTFSAEDEKSILEKFYIKPNSYNTIQNSIKNNTTAFIFGKRGIGKTALLYNLVNELDAKSSFHVIVDDYSSINSKSKKVEQDFLKLFIKKIVETLIFRLMNDRNIINKITNIHVRNELSTIIFSYLDSISKETYINELEKIKGSYTTNNFKKFFNNYLVNISNSILSSATDMLSTTISNSLGLQIPDMGTPHSYIKSLKIDQLEQMSKVVEIKSIFEKLILLIKQLGYENITIFVDRIDEYMALKTMPNKISEFLLPIVSNTSLTMNNDFSFQFLLWDMLKYPLEELGVRFDKIIPLNINLTKQEIQDIMTKRLEYFSDNNVSDLTTLIKNSDLIYDLSEKSPRDILRILYFIYNTQINLDNKSNTITLEAVEEGICQYIYEYNFYYNYPKPSSKKSLTIYDFISNLYSLGTDVFTTDSYSKVIGTKKRTSSNHISKMIEMGLIGRLRNNGDKHYQINSYLVKYTINRTLSIKSINAI